MAHATAFTALERGHVHLRNKASGREGNALTSPIARIGQHAKQVPQFVVDFRLAGDGVRDFVTKHLRSSRAPSRIEFRDALPYNETGKLLRRTVREWLAAGGDGPRG